MKLHLRVYRETVGYFESMCTASPSAPLAVLLPVKRTWRCSLLSRILETFELIFLTIRCHIPEDCINY